MDGSHPRAGSSAYSRASMACPRGPAATASWTSGGRRWPLGDQQLEADQVEAGHRFGDRVLDLQPGVHLEEVGIAVPVHHELDGAGVDVPTASAAATAASTSRRPQRGGHHRGRRLLDDLLVPALDAALPLEQRHRVPVGVGQHLDLDVAGVGHVALEEDGAVAEGGLGLAAALDHRLGAARPGRPPPACPAHLRRPRP